MPLVFGTVFLVLLGTWHLMLGRWSVNDWKELAFSGVLATILVYVEFLCAAVLRHWVGPKIPTPVMGITGMLGAAILVYIVVRFRRRLERRERAQRQADR